MQLGDLLQTLGVELIKLVIAGVVGGFIGSKISFRQFQSQTRFQTKYQDNLRRRDALREIRVILDTVYRDIHAGWKMPEGSTEHPNEHISRLNELIVRTRTLFLDDKEMADTLNSLRSLIGADFAFFMKSGAELPGQAIDRLTKQVEKKISDIEKSLY